MAEILPIVSPNHEGGNDIQEEHPRHDRTISAIPFEDRPWAGTDGTLSFHILETVMSLAVIHAGPKALEAVPVDVLSFPGRIDVVSVGEIKLTIIVIGIVDTILSGTAIVPCHFQISSSPPTNEKRAAKRATPAF